MTVFNKTIVVETFILMIHQSSPTRLTASRRPNLLWLAALVVAIIGLGYLWWVQPLPTPMPPPTQVTSLQGPVMATMDSPVFHYAQPWQLSPTGADPAEPADPWLEPAGALRFTYTGAELALLLAPGDYWGYLYITVDGQPANQLPVLRSNVNSLGQPSGYRTLYAPEGQTDTGPTSQWVRVHRTADNAQPHEVYLELWRGWGQIPLRAVAVDGLPPLSPPIWPGVALLLIAGWLVTVAAPATPAIHRRFLSFSLSISRLFASLRPLLAPALQPMVIHSLAGIVLLLLILGVLWTQWLVTLIALALLGWCSLQRPVLWLAALLFGLPFYFTYTLPLLPGRAFSLIDIGILGGFTIMLGHWVLTQTARDNTPTIERQPNSGYVWWMNLLLALIISWALLAAVQATHTDLALREWRTVFLSGGLFALLLVGSLRLSPQPAADQRLLLGAWLAGALVVAVVGLWQYASNEMLITAEGVQRVRAFYGSPNNLALYLERALAPVIAFALFGDQRYLRWLAVGVAFLLGGALLLTFSKGALLLGVPAMLLVLWLGGLFLLRQRGQSRRLLWVIALIGLLIGLALTPFLGTERFQRLLDFQGGTGFVRLQLWRSAWQMALDHPLFGVGPDNFLYAYRSLYLLPAAWQEPNLNHPHNWPLDWWTRLGLPGLLLALLWFGALIRRHWHGLQNSRQPLLHLGLLAATVAALAHGLIDASYALPDLMIIWVLLTYLPVSAEAPPPPRPG
jgi:O-antigen ligase